MPHSVRLLPRLLCLALALTSAHAQERSKRTVPIEADRRVESVATRTAATRSVTRLSARTHAIDAYRRASEDARFAMNHVEKLRTARPTRARFTPTHQGAMKVLSARGEALRVRTLLHRRRLEMMFARGADVATVAGRIVFPDDHGCASPVWTRVVHWDECHDFKRRLDAAGNPVVTNAAAADALRPLPAKVALAHWVTVDGNESLCEVNGLQLNDDGTFLTPIKGCDADSHRFDLTVSLDFQTLGTIGSLAPLTGHVVAQWKAVHLEGLLDVDPEVFDLSGLAWFDPTGESFTIPTFRVEAIVPAGSSTLDIGTHVVMPVTSAEKFAQALLDIAAGIDDPDEEQLATVAALTDCLAVPRYLRYVLSNYASMVELHRRLRDTVGDATTTAKIYDDDADGVLPHAYRVVYDAKGAHAGFGAAHFQRPTDDGDFKYKHIASTSVVAHEFGHSIHAGLAGDSFKKHYAFASKLQRPEPDDEGEVVYDWGHGFGQHQEVGVGLVEGLGSALGQFLLNGCGNPERPWQLWNGFGAPKDFESNIWSAGGDDDKDGAALHHARYQLSTVRGLSDVSATFADRIAALEAWTQTAANAGHGRVNSHNEARWAAMLCDLMDDEPCLAPCAAELEACDGGPVEAPAWTEDYVEYFNEQDIPLSHHVIELATPLALCDVAPTEDCEFETVDGQPVLDTQSLGHVDPQPGVPGCDECSLVDYSFGADADYDLHLLLNNKLGKSASFDKAWLVVRDQFNEFHYVNLGTEADLSTWDAGEWVHVLYVRPNGLPDIVWSKSTAYLYTYVTSAFDSNQTNANWSVLTVTDYSN